MFGDLLKARKEPNITNSSYRYAYAGRVLPVSVAAHFRARALADQGPWTTSVHRSVRDLSYGHRSNCQDRFVVHVIKFSRVHGTYTLYHKIPNKRRLVDQIKFDITTIARSPRVAITSLESNSCSTSSKGTSFLDSVVVPPKSLSPTCRSSTSKSDRKRNLVRKPLHTHRLDKYCTWCLTV